MDKNELYTKVVNQYETSILGVSHLYINNGANKLIITFAAFNSGDRYSCVTSHSQLTDYDHLFLRDENSSYYLLNSEAYENIYKVYTSMYSPENIVVWGSSMGGYAALKLALKIGCSGMINCPQIDYATSLEYSWKALYLKLKELCDFENIQEVNIDNKNIRINYSHGNHLLDVANTAVFKVFVRSHPNINCEFVQYDSTEHTIFPTFNDFKKFLKLMG